ncbi:nicotinamide riboside transporter PnuC [Thalassomonas actiniarum]|uniref:Nicotinamide riboside transporter PnuC n=1 Tax=Thalassomonas actiniarum TaxID=485447 RepID=A0AAF0C1M0_9GAMM|nr:nicotinamide riboside transporter PnuC [Thalassomonas actiniarum]WDD96895.1 nicotinamide mononucleotide transporter [Thalassomonas actiniarum]
MTEAVFLETVNYFTSLPLLELAAVLTSLLYVVLAAKGNVWCWPAAFISTAIYTAIFYDVYLFMDSLLQVYYLLMAVYGWFCWQKSKNMPVNNVSTAEQGGEGIQSWPLLLHLKVIAVLALVSLGLGYVMANYTQAHFPYFDSATTVFAVFATYLVAQKVLENWLYWVVIDLVSIYLYLEKDLTPTAVLFGLYVVIAAYGYYHWKQSFSGEAKVALT